MEPIYSRRAASVNLGNSTYKDSNEELNNLQEEQKKEWGEELFKAQS